MTYTNIKGVEWGWMDGWFCDDSSKLKKIELPDLKKSFAAINVI